MSKCPFWSMTGKLYKCYSECPMFEEENYSNGDECIFKEYDSSTKVNFKDVSKENYNLLDLSEYDDSKNEKAVY